MTEVSVEEVFGEEVAVTKYDNNNSGALFKNNKRTKETHPTSRGKAMIGGVWYWISGWNKETASGEKFISLAYTEMDAEDVEKYCS